MTATEFMERVSPEPNTGCWLWTGARTGTGYGECGGRGAHRVAWELAHGPIPSGLMVLHKCDNRICVNADTHLFLGTGRDNVQDMFRKGRANRSQGADHYAARLTDADVLAIRSEAAAGAEHAALAAKYGVNRSAVTHILARRRWRSVGGEPYQRRRSK